MGREIVMIPAGFEHPKDEAGYYIEAAHHELLDQVPPEELTHYMVYENTSAGTPISPVFSAKESLIEWLVDQGHSREGAESFVEAGFAPAFFFGAGGIESGIDGMRRIKPGRAARVETRAELKRKLVIYSVIVALWLVAYVWLKAKGF